MHYERFVRQRKPLWDEFEARLKLLLEDERRLAHGELEIRRVRRAEREIEAIAVTALRARLGSVHGGEALSRLAKQVAAGETDPYAAADQLTETL